MKPEDVKLDKKAADSLDRVLRRIIGAQMTTSGISVTPDNCMQSSTVHAVVVAVSKRLALSPVHVYRKSIKGGRESKDAVPDHPVQKLLDRPNDWQTKYEYWLDATSTLIRWGRYHAWKGIAQSGPIRFLHPIDPGAVVGTRDRGRVTWGITFENGDYRQNIPFNQLHSARTGARDFTTADSPVLDMKETIAMEIAAEQFGASYFGNGAMPLVSFTVQEGFQGFRNSDEEDSFINSFQEAYSKQKRLKALLLPRGIEMSFTPLDNDKAQFIQTRKLLRTLIAGAFGVPPHLVGDLERGTFNNVEQQDTDFSINVVLPFARMFEAAMERDLLSDENRSDGIIVRFNLDAVQRADTKTRAEALKVEREAGVISANEWREQTNRNPISAEDGGNDYIRPMNMTTSAQAEEAANKPAPQKQPEDDDNAISERTA